MVIILFGPSNVNSFSIVKTVDCVYAAMLAVVGLRERVLLKQIKRKKIQNIQMVTSPGGDVMQLLPPLALNVHGGIRRGTRRYGARFFCLAQWRGFTRLGW